MYIKKEIKVEGMTCEHCKANVMSALMSIDEVESVDIILEKGIVTVVLNDELSDDVLVEKIQEMDYTVVAIKEEEE